MKIILDKHEVMILLKRSFPTEMIPEGYEVTGVESRGYPDKEFEITIEKEKPKAEKVEEK